MNLQSHPLEGDICSGGNGLLDLSYSASRTGDISTSQIEKAKMLGDELKVGYCRRKNVLARLKSSLLSQAVSLLLTNDSTGFGQPRLPNATPSDTKDGPPCGPHQREYLERITNPGVPPNTYLPRPGHDRPVISLRLRWVCTWRDAAGRIENLVVTRTFLFHRKRRGNRAQRLHRRVTCVFNPHQSSVSRPQRGTSPLHSPRWWWWWYLRGSTSAT